MAGWYDQLLERPDTYQAKVILPKLLRLLPPKGQRIIDIGCGQGFFSRAYAERGADVLGVDISKELIAKARQYKNTKARFVVAVADNIRVAKDASFDGALLVLALQNIKELSATLKEAARVLVDRGCLAIVLNHPCLRVPRLSSWGFDSARAVQYRRIDRYGAPFALKIDMTPGTQKSANKIYTLCYHRPLQDYSKALAAAGFVVSELQEWHSHKTSKPGPRAKAENIARAEFPLFMALLARKQK